MSKKVKFLIGIVVIFLVITFLKFNYIYINKENFDSETKISFLYNDPMYSEEILKKHGFEGGAERQPFSGYVMYGLKYVYKGKFECSIFDYDDYYLLTIGEYGENPILNLKLDGNNYSIYEDGSKYFGNKNNYSDEQIKKGTDYFTKVIDDTYQDYLDTVYSNPIIGRIHFSDMMFKNFIFQENIDFTANKEKP